MVGTIVASIIIFGLLIFVHELGHYLVARLTGIRVLEFAIGFGKELIGWEKGETRYTLRIFPLGGFCKMLGVDPEDPVTEGSFQEKPVLHRLAVIGAGSFMNFLLAAVLFTLLYFFILGVPQTATTEIGQVIAGGPAEEAGIQPGDTVLAINGVETGKWEEVVSTINAHPEQEIELTLQREEAQVTASVVPRDDQGRGIIGIAPAVKKYAFFSSIFLGFSYTWHLIQLIFVSLFQMITGSIPADVAGPVYITAVVGEVMQEGLSNLMSLAAIISINLGIINLLPIPALDGSRMVFLAVEGIRGKPVDPKKEGFIHFIGFTLLILLMIFVVFQDIGRLVF